MLSYTFLFLLASHLLILSAWAQDDSSRSIVKTVDRGDYVFIPATAFAPQVQEVIYQDKPSGAPTHEKTPIEFSWSSICNDGHYTLTITPEQIYFTSGHNNPNPNYIFWAIDINQSEYELIKQNILYHPPTGFYSLSKLYKGALLSYKDKFSDLENIPAGWSDEKFTAYCATQKDRQLTKLFALINSSFKNPQSLIHRPTQEIPKPYNYDVQEVLNRPLQIPKSSKGNK